MAAYFSFQWHITDQCDQRCKHCYIFSEDKGRKPDSMTWPQMQEVLANCLDFCTVHKRKPYFYLTGGDPLLHPDFWKLLELFALQKIPFTIMGNPFHLSFEICKLLKSCGCQKYQLSLDGMRKTHDWLRKAGSFDITLAKIPLIKEAGIRAAIMTTVSGINIKEVPDIIDTAVEYAVDIYAFARYCGSVEDNFRGMRPSEYHELLRVCDKKFKTYESAGCVTFFNRKDHLWTLFEYETGIFKIPENTQAGMIYAGCNCGNSHLTILPNGAVMACRRVKNSKVGNVFEERLADIWVEGMESYRHYTKFKKCASCELLAWCRGCPATASNFYEADPQCWKEAI